MALDCFILSEDGMTIKRARHLFVFSPGVLASLSDDELDATKAGLDEIGLYQMPYERDIYIEISALECIGPDVDPDHSIIYGPFGTDQVVGTAIHFGKTGKVSFWMEYDDPVGIAFLRTALIVLLATKNADKRTTESKLAKLGIGKNIHRFAYTTTISLPGSLPSDCDNPPRGGHIAPHLRRGHVRRQHHGAGNQLEKKIWIAPVFVNADPDFVVARRTYKLGRPSPAGQPSR